MKLRIATSDENGPRRNPMGQLRKWILIGAVAGALLTGVAAMFIVGFVMLGGALVGAAFGAIVGVFRALFALFERS